MSWVLLLVGLFCFVAGLISLIKPLSVLNIHNRKNAAGMLVFGISLVLVGLAQLGSSPTP